MRGRGGVLKTLTQCTRDKRSFLREYRRPDLIQINPAGYLAPADLGQCANGRSAQICAMWQTVANAPFGCDLELAVIDRDGPHALVFPCRRVAGGWTKCATGEWLDVRPTHWREWGAQSGYERQG